MILNIPPEPTALRAWMQSLKRTAFNDTSINWDAYVVWAGNKLPKYLWDHWKDDLRPIGVTWQKFMRILRHRTDVGVMWYQGTLPWADFIRKTIDLIKGPIGKESSGVSAATDTFLSPMDAGALQIPPFSDWEPFERFCRDLWSRIWENPELQRHGRRGQAQIGVDVFGHIKRQPGNLGGIQCKKCDAIADNSLTVAELQKIVADAKKFTPALREFVVAYTGKSDAKLQNEARRLTELNRAENLFSVRVCSWDDIKDIAGKYPDLLEQYNLISTSSVNPKAIEKLIKSEQDFIIKFWIEQCAGMKSILNTFCNTVGELVKAVEIGGGLAGEYSSEIDEIRDLIDSLRPKEALNRITALEKRLPVGVAPTIKFRILANKAVSLVKLGEVEKAGLLFIEAFQYNPEDEKALCNKALGHQLIGQQEEATKVINQILQRNPMSQRAHELLIYNAPSNETLESIIEKIPEVLRTKESVAWALAHAARDRDMMPETLQWLETTLKNADPNKPAPDLKATLAATMLQAFDERYDIQSGMQISPVEKAQIERAISLLDDAINTLEQTEMLKYRAAWAWNRAIAYKLLGNQDKAFADIELAIKLAPGNPMFLRQKAVLLHEQGRSDDAMMLLHKILGNTEVPEVALLLAGIFHERGDNDRAIPMLEESIKDTDKPPDLLSEEKRLLIHAYMGKNQLGSARKIASELRAANPGSVIDLVVTSHIEKRAGNLDASNQLLNEAHAYVSNTTPFRDLFMLADDLYDSKRCADAWPLYERLVDPKSGSPIVNKLIHSYYEAEQYQKAIEATRSVPEKDKSPFVYKIEVSILNLMDDVKGAIAALEKYLTAHPKDLDFKVQWATFLLRDGQTEGLDEFLHGTIDPSQFSDEMRFTMTKQLAGLYAKRKMSINALEVAYQLRKSFLRNRDAHVAYITIFFDREKALDEQLSPNVVAVDTAVAVEETGSPKRWYVIEKDPCSDEDALAPDDPLAKKLIGKKVNDEIVQDEGKTWEARLRIVEIKSKYVYALHESMEKIPYLFGEEENPPLRRLTVKTNTENEAETRDQLIGILDFQLAGREEYILSIQKLYEEGDLPIGTFASLIGRDPVEVWGGLINNPRVGIRCCVGTQEERDDAIKTVHEKKTTAVDLTALLTLANMDRYSLLSDNFEEVFIAQSTVDILTDEIGQKSGLGSDGFMTIRKEGGQYYREEVTVEEIQKQIAFLQKIKTWISINCTIAPVAEILKLSKERREWLYKSIGASFVNTMLIAKEKECAIYTDDYGTRAVASNNFDVKGFWTQALAIAATEKQTLTQEEFEKINTSLCELRYRYTTISSKTLLHAAEVAGWVNTGLFGTVLSGITGSTIEMRSAIGVAVEFFYLLWREPVLSDLRREALVFAVFDAVAQGRNKVDVIQYMAGLIQARFRLIPIAGKHLLKLLAAWRSIRT